MPISEKQTAIINLLRNSSEETLKRSEIIEAFSHWYYCNSEKHISEILFRMTSSGLLVKPKHGFYKIGTGKKPTKQNPINPNQKNLF